MRLFLRTSAWFGSLQRLFWDVWFFSQHHELAISAPCMYVPACCSALSSAPCLSDCLDLISPRVRYRPSIRDEMTVWRGHSPADADGTRRDTRKRHSTRPEQQPRVRALQSWDTDWRCFQGQTSPLTTLSSNPRRHCFFVTRDERREVPHTNNIHTP